MDQSIEAILSRFETTLGMFMGENKRIRQETEKKFETISEEIKEMRRSVDKLSLSYRDHPSDCEKKFVTYAIIENIIDKRIVVYMRERIKDANEGFRLGEYIYKLIMIVGMAGIAYAQFIK